MKLHELAPAKGAHAERIRVGRGIAAGKGKTAGRGTKGQKSRAGGSLPAWFEGGQTPLHQRIPKLRGFRNRSRIEYETVNVGRIAEAAAAGRLPSGELPGAKKSAKPAPITANAELLRAAGVVRRLDRPLKILGGGDIDMPIAVIADAFTASAIAKIEAAGGSATKLEVPAPPAPARRRTPSTDRTTEREPVASAAEADVDDAVGPAVAEEGEPEEAAQPEADVEEQPAAEAATDEAANDDDPGSTTDDAS
jgi:large subunit ribosomal protein L15